MAKKKASSQTTVAEQTITIELQTPANDDRPVFLVGNFNDWQPGEERYQLTLLEAGRYRYVFEDLSRLPEIIEYKFTRGDWGAVEKDRFGNKTPNRRIPREALHIVDHVPRWKQEERPYDPRFLPRIQIISEAFEIPQLIKTRRIAALLPHDYHETDRSYPVLYLQDGQNLFDDFAPYGNWGLDKKLAVMSEQGLGDIIVIAIDHAESERIAEFTPSMQTRLGSGEGKKYVRFLADTLKPYVDQHFRTLPDRAHTGIGGSSMGGLISIYAGLMYPEVYSRLMIFSPSLWVVPHIHFHFIHFLHPQDTRIYLYGGESESANMVPNICRFKEELEKADTRTQVEFALSIDPNGEHNEARWGEEFPRAVAWLFFNTNTEG